MNDARDTAVGDERPIVHVWQEATLEHHHGDELVPMDAVGEPRRDPEVEADAYIRDHVCATCGTKVTITMTVAFSESDSWER